MRKIDIYYSIYIIKLSKQKHIGEIHAMSTIQRNTYQL